MTYSRPDNDQPDRPEHTEPRGRLGLRSTGMRDLGDRLAGLPSTALAHGRQGLTGKGNRVLLGVGVGWVVATFANLLNASAVVYLAMWIVVGVVTYVLTAPPA